MNFEITERPTWTEISLSNLAFNFHSVKEFVGQAVKYMAVVKADAYGHGAVECSQRLEKEGVDWFGVALPKEGVELREAGILKRILCLGGFWAGQEELLLDHKLTPVIFRIEQAENFNETAKLREMTAEIHVKIDTGMGRIGVRFDEVEAFVERLKPLDNLQVEGIMTHFASADDLGENDFTNLQIERFEEAVSMFEDAGFRPTYKDLANSPASVAHPKSRGNMVRLGGVLYGLGDDVLPKGIELPELKPVLSMYSRIASVKKIPKGETLGYGRKFETQQDSIIATLPIGYQDGYLRGFSNKANVIVAGKLVPVVGRISMDWTILDVTEIEGVRVGDPVVLIGEIGDESVSAADLAKHTNTISYEITCGIDTRVKRNVIE